MIRLAETALVLLLFAAHAGIASSCEIVGSVLSRGHGLPDVTVNLALRGSLERIATTDQLGRFKAEVPSFDSRAMVVILVLQKPSYSDHTVIRPAHSDGSCPLNNVGDITMHPQDSGPPSVSGRLTSTVLVSPYGLYGSIEDVDWHRLNRNLALVIGHRVQSFRTSLPVHPLPPELSIRALDQPLSMVDMQRIRAIGEQHLAISVVTGEGELRRSSSGEEFLDLSSVVSIIARHPSFQERHLRVDDTLPRMDARPTQLSSHLRDFWGQKAIIALIVRELAELPHSPSEDQVLEIRNWLIELRATMTHDNPLLTEVNQLLAIVNQEAGR